MIEGGKGTKMGAKNNPWAMFVKKMGGVKKAIANKSQYTPVSKPKPKPKPKAKAKAKAPAKPKGKRGRPKGTKNKPKGGSFVF